MQLALLIFLLAVNALLVTAELAIISARRSRLEHLADRGSRGAKAALALANAPLRFLSTIQMGITLVAILSGAVGERALAASLERRLSQVDWLAPHAGIVSFAIVVFAITYFTLVLGELVPKRLAMAFPDRIAVIVSRPLELLARVCAPLVALLSGSTGLILRVLGVRDQPHADLSEDDIRGLIRQGVRAGILEAREQELLDRVFRLGDRKVKSLMVPRADITWIDSTAPAERVRVIVATSPYSHFPVCEGSLDKIVGVVHVKDLVKHGLVHTDEFSVAVIAQPPLFVPEGMSALRLIDVFHDKHRHLAFVVDEFGGVEGLVTLNDLVERILGDVAVSTPGETPAFVRRDDGSFLVDGAAPLSDLWEKLSVHEPPEHDFEDVNTVGGLVVAVLGRFPRAGETATFAGLRFEVVDLDRRRIDKLLITRVHPTPGAEETPA